MFGSIYMEMSFLSILGDIFGKSRWTQITSALVVRPGAAESLISGYDIARTKYCYQATVSALNKLKQKAFESRPHIFFHLKNGMLWW